MSAKVGPEDQEDVEEGAGSEIREFVDPNHVKMKLPKSSYSSAACLVAIVSHTDKARWARAVAGSCIHLIATIGVQTIYIYYIVQIHLEQMLALTSGKCNPLPTVLRITCLSMFTVTVLDELSSTIEFIHLTLIAVPTAANFATCRFMKNPNGSLKLASGGFTKLHKVYIAVCIALPRALIAISLLFVGITWLSSSVGTTTLLLHTLSLKFVMTTDDMVYSFFVSYDMKNFLEAFPVFEYKRTSKLWPWMLVIKLIGVAFIVLVAVMVFRHGGEHARLECLVVA